MPLPIRDGNQSLTTLSTILVSNAHIPAHTVISFGTQGITDIATAVSGVELGPNTLNALENITVTLGQVTITGGLTDAQLRASAVTVGGSVTASISGTPSVTFGTVVVTGSTSILNFPATQAVTFTQASVTFGTSVVTGSTSVLNFPAIQTVTFTQASVTFGTAVITGSTSIIGTPSVTFTQIATHGVTIGAGTAQIGSVTASISGTPSVTFTTAPVTFGTSVVTGSVSVLNIPATQTVTFSQAPVTFGLISGTVTANNFTLTNALQYDGSHYFLKVGGVATTGGTSFPVYVAGSVTVGNSITIGSLPAISGTVTANVTTKSFIDGILAFVADDTPIPVYVQTALPAGTNRIGVVTIGSGTVTLGASTAQIGSVTASISNSLTISSLPAISGTVTANNFVINDLFGSALEIVGEDEASYAVRIQGSTASPVPISGTVTANLFAYDAANDQARKLEIADTGIGLIVAGSTNANDNPVIISGTVTANPTGTQTIAGTVTANVFGTGYNNVAYSLPVGLEGLDAVTRGIGIGFHENLTADEFKIVRASEPFPVQVRAGTVTIGSLPAISGTVTANGLAVGSTVANVFPIGVDTLFSGVRTVTDLVGYRLPISLGDSNTVVTIANIQGTAVTTSNFTSLTPSTVLAEFNATREVLTIFNEGAGNLHICAGATCTTLAYQVRLSAGDYYEAPLNQTSLTHSAVFATAGTARIVQIS
jgi:hypothetical protein